MKRKEYNPNNWIRSFKGEIDMKKENKPWVIVGIIFLIVSIVAAYFCLVQEILWIAWIYSVIIPIVYFFVVLGMPWNWFKNPKVKS